MAGNKRRVQINPKGEYTINIPRGLAQGLGLSKGQFVEWSVISRNKLEAVIRRE